MTEAKTVAAKLSDLPGTPVIDDTWSALRFRPLQPGEAPFVGR